MCVSAHRTSLCEELAHLRFFSAGIFVQAFPEARNFRFRWEDVRAKGLRAIYSHIFIATKQARFPVVYFHAKKEALREAIWTDFDSAVWRSVACGPD